MSKGKKVFPIIIVTVIKNAPSRERGSNDNKYGQSKGGTNDGQTNKGGSGTTRFANPPHSEPDPKNAASHAGAMVNLP
jgi:hypothetical protein